MKKATVNREDPIRLDRFMQELEPEFSRAAWQRVIDEGSILVNETIAKASLKVKQGDVISYELPVAPPTSVIPEAIALDIVYEDEWLAVINKPRGMVVHPAPGHPSGTLVNALMARFGTELSSVGGDTRPGIVHRIDKDTSGLILAVKDNTMHKKLAALLKRHEIVRAYDALVYGQPDTIEGSIDAPIGRDPRNRQKMAVVADGKPAVSHFRLIDSLARGSHLQVELETGRTHQIRVHLAFIGLPVVGDPVYAKGRPAFGIEGQALHAGRLSFTHPISGESIQVSAPPPADFLACKEALNR
ncbi:MAG TPA: RluA family pseudouridine synthase [Fastidiosipila sp.]|jgi:23S rRNA pseudouridine1911/1915/1917 synthase|nr:RluA family pseudouridine synthase [Fastidiosipila sp.]